MPGGTYLEPTINVTSPESYNYESVPRGLNQLPENQFEAALNRSYGVGQALSFMASDGVAFANAENPSFGGTVVSTGISNMAGTQFSGAGAGGFGAIGFGGGGSSLNTSIGAQFNTSGQTLGNTSGFPGGGTSLVSNSGGTTTDGFNPGGVKQGILDEGLQQILLMVEVQQASRTIDAMSNILKTKYDADMNTIRNIRSG